MSLQELVQQFVLLWTVVDPVGTVPVFVALTMGMSLAQQRRIAWQAVGVAASVLLFFALVGELLLQLMSIPLAAFQVAGGLVLFLFALSMVFGPSKPESEMDLPRQSAAVAVFPLALPSIASPGALMAVVMLTDGHRYSPQEQFVTMFLLLLVLGLCLCLLLVAPRLQAILGDAGASLISRVMGLLLAAIAASNVMAGIAAYYKLPIQV